MTVVSFVFLVLAPCVMLPGILVAFLYARSESVAGQSKTQEMRTLLKGLRTDVGELDLDCREQAWRRENWGGPESYVASRMTDSSHQVIVLTTYAEASVPLASEGGSGERRQCSLCLN